MVSVMQSDSVGGVAAEDAGLAALVLRLVARRIEAVRSLARLMDLPVPFQSEAERLTMIRAAAQPPERCGPDMPAAPARGPVVAVQPQEMRRTEDGYDLVHTGFCGRDALRAADAFDIMARQARRAGGGDPFTPRQRGAGRDYAGMVERHSANGLKGRSIEVMRGGSGPTGGVADLVLAEGLRIRAMQAAVGQGFALAVRRQGKGLRRAVRLIDLVDAVCLHGVTLDHVLRRHGWSCQCEPRQQLQAALAAALDRMAMV